MPKILINEKDFTTPGSMSEYGNYSVLITGFTARKPVLIADVEAEKEKNPDSTLKADLIQPDSNGVYEFNKAEDFENIIGLKEPKIFMEGTAAAGETFSYHYGNQMAYELLKLGYPIIYKPLKFTEDNNTPAKVINTLADDSFWEIFKDKASYDFRFITHGLLQLDINEEVETLKNNEYDLDLLDKLKEDLLTEIEGEDKDILYDSSKAAGLGAFAFANDDVKAEYPNQDLELVDVIERRYDNFITNTLTGKEYAKFLLKKDIELPAELPEDCIQTFFDVESVPGAFTTILAEISKLEKDIEGQCIVSEQTINAANLCIANLAAYVEPTDTKSIPGRGDCTALIEVCENLYTSAIDDHPETLIIKAIQNMTKITKANGAYCAMTVPSVIYKMADDERFQKNKKFPGAFHYLACFMNSLKSGYAEWYAAAGYTRGVSNYVIDYTTVKLGEIAINALEPRNIVSQDTDPIFSCNVIANFRGSYYLWGNRTAYRLGDAKSADEGDLIASHFLNIRQLCTTIKKQLYVACRRFTFDPNSDTLWINFCNAIRPTLNAMKADQGIRDYKILKVSTDKKATLKAKIRIIPIEAVEDFDLEVSLEDSFGETTAVITE